METKREEEREDTLTASDLKLIREVHGANAAYGSPYLPAQRNWRRAKALAERGLLKAHGLEITPPAEGLDGYTVTDEGVNAYNAAVKARAPSPTVQHKHPRM